MVPRVNQSINGGSVGIHGFQQIDKTMPCWLVLLVLWSPVFLQARIALVQQEYAGRVDRAARRIDRGGHTTEVLRNRQSCWLCKNDELAFT